jgi:hypothetical protein
MDADKKDIRRHILAFAVLCLPYAYSREQGWLTAVGNLDGIAYRHSNSVMRIMQVCSCRFAVEES